MAETTLRGFAALDFADEFPPGAAALAGAGAGAGAASAGATGIVRAGGSRLLWQLAYARGAWQLVVGRLRRTQQPPG